MLEGSTMIRFVSRTVLLLVLIIYFGKSCSGQGTPVLGANLEMTCLNREVMFTCEGYGRNILIVSPPLVPDTDFIGFRFDDDNGTMAVRGPNSEAISVLEHVLPDGSGNSHFRLTLRLPLISLGLTFTQCSVQQGQDRVPNQLDYTVIDSPQSVDRIVNMSTPEGKTEISWMDQEDATMYEIQINTTDAKSVQTINSTRLRLDLASGFYNVNVISMNVCGRSNATSILVTVLPEGTDTCKRPTCSDGTIIAIVFGILAIACMILVIVSLITLACYFWTKAKLYQEILDLLQDAKEHTMCEVAPAPSGQQSLQPRVEPKHDKRESNQQLIKHSTGFLNLVISDGGEISSLKLDTQKVSEWVTQEKRRLQPAHP